MIRLAAVLARLLPAALIVLATSLDAGAASRPLVEASVWGGYTGFSGSGGPGTSSRSGEGGVRSVELAHWPSDRLRLFARFENTLSLDNLELIRAGRSVEQYSGGALFDWGGRFTTVAQAGHRRLPGDVSQTLVSAEQVLYLPGGAAVKAGGQAGPRDDGRTEWLVLAGTNVPVVSRLRLEPTVFLSGTGRAGESQWRALLVGEVALERGLRIGAGLAGGRNESADAAFTGRVWDSHARVTLGIGDLHRVHLLLRHEEAAGARPLTTISAGVSVGLPRR